MSECPSCGKPDDYVSFLAPDAVCRCGDENVPGVVKVGASADLIGAVSNEFGINPGCLIALCVAGMVLIVLLFGGQ